MASFPWAYIRVCFDAKILFAHMGMYSFYLYAHTFSLIYITLDTLEAWTQMLLPI